MLQGPLNCWVSIALAENLPITKKTDTYPQPPKKSFNWNIAMHSQKTKTLKQYNLGSVDLLSYFANYLYVLEIENVKIKSVKFRSCRKMTLGLLQTLWNKFLSKFFCSLLSGEEINGKLFGGIRNDLIFFWWWRKFISIQTTASFNEYIHYPYYHNTKPCLKLIYY